MTPLYLRPGYTSPTRWLLLGLFLSQVTCLTFFENIKNVYQQYMNASKNNFNLLDNYVLDFIPISFGSPPCNQNGTFSQFKEYMFYDRSNDNLAAASVHEMITAAGFKQKNLSVAAQDGYITQLIQVINPLADKTKLKKPPVILFHGGVVDPSLFCWASIRQHHPEPWPRAPSDGPMTSWNRSLAFVLANNGYDVWLAGTRGSDYQNRRKSRTKAAAGLSHIPIEKLNMTEGERLNQFNHLLRYWPFSMDEITEHEFPQQVYSVLKETNSSRVSILTYSFSSMTSLPFMSIRPVLAKKRIHNLILVAPIINHQGSNEIIKSFCRMFQMIVPEPIGEVLGNRLLLNRFNRKVVATLADNMVLRYTLAKLITVMFSGSSAKWRTFLEPAVMTHLLKTTSFMQTRHYCQQVRRKRMQKFDYGYLTNLLIYGHLYPPTYNLTNIQLNNWILISGGTDNLAPPSSIQQILEEMPSPPDVNINIKGYNHLDLFAGFDNDKLVNLPILEFLDSHTM